MTNNPTIDGVSRELPKFYEPFQCPECETGTLKEQGYAWHCDSCDFIAPEQDGELDE